MDRGTAQLILNVTKLECLLCKEKFKIRFSLRNHLKREHTDIEAEKFIKKYVMK